MRSAWELAALVATVLAWFGAEALGIKVAALAVLATAWVAYFLVRARRDPGLWRQWGFRRGPRGAWRVYTATIGALAGAAILFGLVTGRGSWSQGLLLVALLYPAWAVAQQFLVQDVLVANLREHRVPPAILPALGGIGFGLSHLPDWPLCTLAAAGGVLWVVLFQRWPNLLLLGLTHALVGTAAFVFVLDRDPLTEYPELARLLA